MKRPSDIADRHRTSRDRQKIGNGLVRATYVLAVEDARAKAREFLVRYPPAAYMTQVESWRELSDGRIEFTMRRLPAAD
jgi:hypothetical protein